MKNNKNKVALVQRIFPHYRLEIFNKLNQKYDFILTHAFIDGDIPQVESSFSIKRKLVSVLGFKYLLCSLAVVKFKPVVLIQEFSISFLNLYVNYALSRIMNIKFVLWGHGYDTNKGFHPRSNMADRIRQFFIKRADAVIFYTDKIRDELSIIDGNKKMFVAKNSIESRYNASLYKALSKEGREKVAADLGYKHGLNLIFISRIYENKKPFLLVNVAEQIKSQCGNAFHIHVIGEGELKEELIEQIKNTSMDKHFSFYGAIYEELQVGKMIFSADFVLIPAWLGLSVNHAFCYGTPVMTLINEKHPPEIAFAIDGYNSVLASDVKGLTLRACELSKDKESYLKMRRNCRAYFEKELSLNSMEQGFTDAIEYVTANRSNKKVKQLGK